MKIGAISRVGLGQHLAQANRLASGDSNGIKTNDSNTGRNAAGAGQAAGGTEKGTQEQMQGKGEGIKTIANLEGVANELTFNKRTAPLSGNEVAALGAKHAQMVASVTGAGGNFNVLL